MKTLFKKIRHSVPAGQAVQRHSSVLLRYRAFKKRLADRMQLQSERLSLKTKKLLLLAGCFLGIAYCSLLITGRASWGSLPHMDIIGTTILPGHNPERNLTSADIERVKKVQQYLDSLNQTDTGKELRTKILAANPGLLDSLAKLELFINHHKK